MQKIAILLAMGILSLLRRGGALQKWSSISVRGGHVGKRSGHEGTASSTALGTSGRRELLALDFDGVLCKSDGESSYSSIIAAREQWPEECTIEYSFELNRVRRYISELRPVIDTGYENMILVWYILETLRVDGICDVDSGCTIDTTPLLTEWCPELRDSLIE